MRRNHSQTAKRRSHHAISGVRLSVCECGAKRASHRACTNCGKYNDRTIIDITTLNKRTDRRIKRKVKDLEASGKKVKTAA